MLSNQSSDHYTLANADENYFIPTKGTPKFKIEGTGTITNKVSAMNAKKDGFMSDTYLTFARRFKAHDVNAQAGFRYINNSMILTSMTGYNSGNDKTPNMNGDLKFKDRNVMQAIRNMVSARAPTCGMINEKLKK